MLDSELRCRGRAGFLSLVGRGIGGHAVGAEYREPRTDADVVERHLDDLRIGFDDTVVGGAGKIRHGFLLVQAASEGGIAGDGGIPGEAPPAPPALAPAGAADGLSICMSAFFCASALSCDAVCCCTPGTSAPAGAILLIDCMMFKTALWSSLPTGSDSSALTKIL